MTHEMMGFGTKVASAQHTQIIWHQTDNHINTSSLIFYRLDALPVAQPTVSKHCRQFYYTIAVQRCLLILQSYCSHCLCLARSLLCRPIFILVVYVCCGMSFRSCSLSFFVPNGYVTLCYVTDRWTQHDIA